MDQLAARVEPARRRPAALLHAARARRAAAAGICGILFGAFGVHKFILGYTGPGLIMLASSLVGAFVCVGLPTAVMSIIGIIEGIIYLTKSDEEFVTTYVINKRTWF